MAGTSYPAAVSNGACPPVSPATGGAQRRGQRLAAAR
jgi:hypothetical protein